MNENQGFNFEPPDDETPGPEPDVLAIDFDDEL